VNTTDKPVSSARESVLIDGRGTGRLGPRTAPCCVTCSTPTQPADVLRHASVDWLKVRTRLRLWSVPLGREITLYHETKANNEPAIESARRTVAETSIIVAELRRFVRLCRLQPAAIDQVADFAQVKPLLAETRTRLARARQELF
jgi:hypothetical protein